jgi:membrane protein DedA with SNARE-associated domain
MPFTQLLADHGYLAVLIGSLLEGETILVLAGFAAHQGHLSLPLVLAIAFVGGTFGDQIFFWLGRT